MLRELLGDFGEGLSASELGAALAGSLALHPVGARARVVGPWLPQLLLTSPSASPGRRGMGAHELRAAWLFEAARLARPETPSRFGIAIGVILEHLRIAPGPWTPEACRWLVEALGAGELVAAVHVVTAPAQAAAEWLWPLEVGILDDAESRELGEVMSGLHYKRFASVSSAARATAPFEILALPHSLGKAATQLLGRPGLPRVQAVLVLGGTGDVRDPLMVAEALRVAARADAVCILNVLPPQRAAFLDAFLAHLSHDLDVDVAFSGAARELGLGAALMVACDGGFARAHVSVWAQGIASRLARTAGVTTLIRPPDVDAGLESLALGDAVLASLAVEPSSPVEEGRALANAIDTFRWDSEHGEASEMATLGASVRSRRPVVRERHVLAELFDHEGAKVNVGPLQGDRLYRLEVWIGSPSADVLVAPATFPEADLPPSAMGHLLAVVLTTTSLGIEPQVRCLHLSPTGCTARVSFELPITRGLAQLQARVTVLHANRIVQTVLLRVGVGEGPPEPLRLGLEGIVRRDLDGLGGRRPFDAALLFNDLGEGPTMSLFKDREASLVRSDRIGEALGTLAEQLQDATSRPGMYGTPEKRASTALLGDLARQGSLLRDALFEMGSVRKQLADAKRIQIIAAKPEDVLPLELCYDPPAPRAGAKMCEQWKAALESGACQAACPTDRSSVVCPVGFWGMQRCIERHAYSQAQAAEAQGNDFAIVHREPMGGRRLALGGGSLCAAATRARAKDPEAIDKAFLAAAQAAGGAASANEVTDWETWRKEIDTKAPRLLVLLPHTELQNKLQVMVIHEKEVALITDVRADFVAKQDGDGPIVILLGCSTAKQQGFQAFTTMFRRAGALIVVGTLCKVLGRHSGPIAQRLIEKLHAASQAAAPTPVGDLMPLLRRELLAEGTRLFWRSSRLVTPIGVFDMTRLQLELLPAHHGDCLLIEYGPAGAVRRILIDGGTPESFAAVDGRLAEIAEAVPLELLVVTHVDEDHIGGTLAQLVKNASRLRPKDVWFNAYKHLFAPDQLGPAQGEGLSTAIEAAQLEWNQAFREGSVVVPDDGPLPVIQLEGGATITLLSPSWEKLEQLRSKWEAACKKAKLIPGEGADPDDVLGKRDPPEGLDEATVRALAKSKFTRDKSKPNGSSIAFIFEYGGKRLLLTGDAHPDVLVSSLDRYSDEPVPVDAWKMSHHGSRGNLDKRLLDKVITSRYLFSTDSGTFGHPDPETIARIVTHHKGAQLLFNYDTDYTRPWSESALCESFKYEAVFPDADDDGHLVLEL